MAKTSRSKKATEQQARFHQIADELEPRFKSNWTRTVRAWQSDVDMVRALRDLSTGKIDAHAFAARAGKVLEVMPESLRQGLNVMQLKGLNLQSDMLGLDKVKIAGEYANKWSGQRITNITNSTREAINTFVTGSITEGMTPTETARQIREVLAVDSKFARAALNYRNGMKALEKKPGVVEKQTASYLRRAAAQRAQTIARTETIAALSYGQRTALSAARSAGLLDDDVMQVWITAPGCCDRCTRLDGVTTNIGGVWSVDEFVVEGPPFHPNCRCTIGVK